MTVEAGVRNLTPIVVGVPFYDGPQWVEVAGIDPYLAYSDVNGRVVRKLPQDGGTPGTLRTITPALGANLPTGNAIKNGVVLTGVSADPNGLLPAPGIYQTTAAGDAGSPTLATAPSTNINDLVVTPNGTILFTDPQYQTSPADPTKEGLWRMAPDGGVALVTQTNLFRPNGIALTSDGKTLYVGQGPLDGDPNAAVNRKIIKYTVAADGTVTVPGTTFVDAPQLAAVPDGLAVDVGGNVYVAEAATNNDNSGAVEVFSPTGVKLGTILFNPDRPGRPTGVAFGGTDGKALYITTETGIFLYVNRCAGVK